MPIRKFEQEEIDNIIKDYNNGITIKDLELKYKRKDSVIIMKLQALGIYTNVNSRWNKDELIYLKNNYSEKDWDELLINLARHTRDSIIAKAYKLKIKKENYYWSEEDVKIIKDNYSENISMEQLVILLHNKFTAEAVYTKANKLGFKIREFWTDDEIEILKKHYNNLSIDEILILLPNRHRKSIIRFANNLGLVSAKTWKDTEKQFIIDNWQLMSDYELSEELHRNWNATLSAT